MKDGNKIRNFWKWKVLLTAEIDSLTKIILVN